MKALLVAVFVAAVSLPGVVSAATWCVPDDEVRTTCPHVAPSVQAAVDDAMLGSVIWVGSNDPPERVVVNKRVTIRCLPGGKITDAGLPASSSQPVLHYTGIMTAPRIEKCHIENTNSAGGILIDPTVKFMQMKGLTITCTKVPRKGYGVRVYDNPRVFFLGAGKDVRPSISGCDIGFDSRGGGWLNSEAPKSVNGPLFEDNRVGIRSVNDKGQLFFSELRNNDIGIEIRGNFHQDVNSNRFFGNLLGLLWGLSDTPNPASGCTSQKNMEMNHGVFEGNDVAVLVETSPGVYTQDITQDPSSGTEWRITIDGEPVEWKTGHKTTPVCLP